MINKIAETIEEAVSHIFDGAIIMIGGFGIAGAPTALVNALNERDIRGLTLITNSAGRGEMGTAGLLKKGRVKKIICSYPRSAEGYVFAELYRSHKIELELAPQGSLAVRIEAAGAGLGAIYTPTGYGTELTKGKETREINGRHYVLEYPLHADFALIKADKGDRYGNLIYSKSARNFGPIMAAAANFTIAQVNKVVELGELNPEAVITPGIFVNQIVALDNH